MVNSVEVFKYTRSKEPFFFIKTEDYNITDGRGSKMFYTKCYIISEVEGRLTTLKKSLITSIVEECECVNYISNSLMKAIMSDTFM